MFGFDTRKMVMPQPDDALPGRNTRVPVPERHQVLGTSLTEFPAGTTQALFGMGCFWGAERLFWQESGVFTTAVGYSAGFTPNPIYEEVCSGQTGHNEVVLVVYWPEQISYAELLRLFWENHNPTQGMRQANDRGTQYRSGIYCFDKEQRGLAEASRAAYQVRLEARSAGTVSTEIVDAGPFYYAEPYHQQYLAKNPNGYCNLQTLSKSGLPALGEIVKAAKD
jgi:peptide-methionine (S)-S-oxide reductase